MTDFTTLMPIRTKGDQPPLFCVHGQPLKTAMTTKVKRPVYGLSHVYYASFQDKTADTIEELAAEYLADMRKVCPTGPYYLLGFSAGAMVAYEIARQLQAAGQTVAHMVLVEPSFVAENQATSGRFAELLETYIGKQKFNLAYFVHLPKRLLRSTKARILNLVNRAYVFLLLKTGRELPEDLRWIGYLKSLGPAINAYVYAPLKCRSDLIYGDLDESSRQIYAQFWTDMLGKSTRIQFVEGVRKHSDFMLEPHMSNISKLLDDTLLQTGT